MQHFRLFRTGDDTRRIVDINDLRVHLQLATEGETPDLSRRHQVSLMNGDTPLDIYPASLLLKKLDEATAAGDPTRIYELFNRRDGMTTPRAV